MDTAFFLSILLLLLLAWIAVSALRIANGCREPRRTWGAAWNPCFP
jgi:hypothetical protein